jgi:hypothetical protein
VGAPQSGDHRDRERLDLDQAARDNVAATDVKLSPDALKACDDVWRSFRVPTVFYGR